MPSEEAGRGAAAKRAPDDGVARAMSELLFELTCTFFRNRAESDRITGELGTGLRLVDVHTATRVLRTLRERLAEVQR